MNKSFSKYESLLPTWLALIIFLALKDLALPSAVSWWPNIPQRTGPVSHQGPDGECRYGGQSLGLSFGTGFSTCNDSKIPTAQQSMVVEY